MEEAIRGVVREAGREVVSNVVSNVASNVDSDVGSKVVSVFGSERRALDEAVCALRAGEAVIFPTETVYGLGVSIKVCASPRLLYDLKGRADSKPISWLVGSVADLGTYGDDVPAYATALAARYWPGPLTLVVKAGASVSAAYRSTEGTIGLRMPDDEIALTLVKAAGCPLATTSANPSGAVAPATSAELDPALTQKVGAVVVREEQGSGTASTVVDCTSDRPRVLREGSIVEKEIMAVADSVAAGSVSADSTAVGSMIGSTTAGTTGAGSTVGSRQ